MSDSKYGRLFTEDDVREMLLEAVCDAMKAPVDMTAAEIVDGVQRVSRFPADEPLFLLRGQDAAAPNAIGRVLGLEGVSKTYAEECEARGASAEHVTNVRRAAEMMGLWQISHPDRVKVPDV